MPATGFDPDLAGGRFCAIFQAFPRPEADTPADTLDRLKNALADSYDVQRELGSGGMATVYIARDLKHGRAVAIKVLRPELAAVLGTDRFLREIEIAANLVHPHILPLHDSGEADGLLYYVMPFVEGESLRALLERERQLSIDETLKITGQVLSALSHAHSRGIVHRDIKPENILLSAGEAVVADFGIARAIGVAGSRLTQAGMSLGTPAYMSPEQIAGDEDVDARSDIYSVGCMLYEMLSGEPPFTGGAETIIEQQLTAQPPRVSQQRSTVTPEVEEAILTALQKTPADRFPTAARFKEAISRVTTSSRVVEALEAERAATIPRPALRSRPPVLIAAAALVLAVVAGAGAMLFPFGSVPFEERGWIVIASFENLTGDSIFDRTLDRALASSIAQSRQVNVFPEARTRETLQRMGQAGTSRLDEPLATEVAVREGLVVVLVPSITGVGGAFSLSARIVDATTGVDLTAVSADASSRSEVLEAVDRLGRAVRRRLGESRLDLVRSGGFLPRATTSSLEALRAFTDGSQAWTAGEYQQARSLWEEALGYDSTFAWAHASMGLMDAWFNDRPKAEVHFERALASADRLTKRERLWIRSLVAGSRGQPEEAINILQVFLRDYPDDRDAWFNLGSGYMRLQRCDEAIPALERVLSLDSGMVNAYLQMATCLNSADRPTEAIPLYRSAFAIDTGAVLRGFINHEYGSALVKAGYLDDAEQAFRLMFDEDPSQRARGQRSLALLDMFQGRYREAVDLFGEAIRTNQITNQGLSELRNRLYLAAALRTRGDSAGFLRQLRAADNFRSDDSFFIGPYFLLLLGKMHVRAGDLVTAEAVVTDIDSAMGESDGDRAALELLQGEVALARGDTAGALELLELAVTRRGDEYFRESLAHAYDVAGRIDDAIREYQRMADGSTFGTESQEPWMLAHYELGRLYEERGDYREAVASYERFVSLWQGADSDLAAAVGSVRSRIANLRRTHGIG